MKQWIKNLDAKRFASFGYSQSYQDSLLEEIFSHILPRNEVPFCVEFGFNSNSLTGGSGANVAYLVQEKGWSCLLLDSEQHRPEINLHRHHLTSANVASTLSGYSIPREPEYISIDVDSTDLWLFRAVVAEYRAMVFSVEYNPNFPLGVAASAPDHSEWVFNGDKAYGASLSALNMVAQSNGYSLIWVVPGLDLFFVRDDLIDDGSGQLTFPLEKWKKATRLPRHRPVRDDSRLREFIDFSVFVATDGNVRASTREGYVVARRYLGSDGYELLLSFVRALVRPSKRMIQLLPVAMRSRLHSVLRKLWP